MSAREFNEGVLPPPGYYKSLGPKYRQALDECVDNATEYGLNVTAMKAKLRLWAVSPLTILAVCTVLVGILKFSERAGWAALPTIQPSDPPEKSQAAKRTDPRLRLEVNVVEYPAEKGADVFRLMAMAAPPAGVTIDTPRVLHTGPLPEKPSPISTGLSSSDAPLTWILNKGLNEFILDKLNQSADAQVIAGPRVVAAEGRQTKVEFEYPGRIVTQLGPRPNNNEVFEALDAFPTLYVQPEIKGDGYTIDLKTTQAIRDLVGYNLGGGPEDIWDYVESAGANPAPASLSFSGPRPTTPKPLFRLREVTGNAVVRNGQTLVLSGLTASTVSKTNISNSNKVPLLGDLPLAGRLFRAHTIAPEKKKLLVFITPTIVGEDGKPIHEQAAPEDTAPTPVK